MSPEIQEWSHKSRSRMNNFYLLTRPISAVAELHVLLTIVLSSSHCSSVISADLAFLSLCILLSPAVTTNGISVSLYYAVILIRLIDRKCCSLLHWFSCSIDD